ncbi:MAG: bifunctional (p)ppGpp synthetase/guanosine-3',5'-bis(diphosphate) 3'-pyrophosphohydrolase [Phycisphaerales bacterium]|nr:bifunctional (p)ppGpp synthetase/guanosine-3',5'-bis(diphosphate) 3'-pyrophosphohydrolase [Phycisphaerales bacterium]
MSTPRTNLGLWHAAAGLSARMHAGQVRKDGVTPYAAHPFRVMMIVRDLFACDDDITLAAALLHDVIEDTPGDFDDVAECAGAEAARVVAALTKDMRLPEDERESAYDEAIRAACWRTKLIKLADCYDNLTDLASRRDNPDPARVIDKAHRAIACADGEPAAARAVSLLRALISRVQGG